MCECSPADLYLPVQVYIIFAIFATLLSAFLSFFREEFPVRSIFLLLPPWFVLGIGTLRSVLEKFGQMSKWDVFFGVSHIVLLLIIPVWIFFFWHKRVKEAEFNS